MTFWQPRKLTLLEFMSPPSRPVPSNKDTSVFFWWFNFLELLHLIPTKKAKREFSVSCVSEVKHFFIWTKIAKTTMHDEKTTWSIVSLVISAKTQIGVWKTEVSVKNLWREISKQKRCRSTAISHAVSVDVKLQEKLLQWKHHKFWAFPMQGTHHKTCQSFLHV